MRNGAHEWRVASLGGRDGLTSCWSLAALRRIAEPMRHLSVGMMHVDVPGISWVNHRLGHQTGDLLLRDIAHRLARMLPQEPDVILARSGGDEFCILTAEIELLDDLAQVARDVLAMPRLLRRQSRIEEPDDVLEVVLGPLGVVTISAEPGWDVHNLVDQASARLQVERVQSGLSRKPTMTPKGTAEGT